MQSEGITLSISQRIWGIIDVHILMRRDGNVWMEADPNFQTSVHRMIRMVCPRFDSKEGLILGT
jgi:hypothetical protein